MGGNWGRGSEEVGRVEGIEGRDLGGGELGRGCGYGGVGVCLNLMAWD